MSANDDRNESITRPLEILKYGHPALRSKGSRVEKIDSSIRKLAEEMIVTMYDAEGCGLAAQQIGRSLQLAVIDVMPALEERPSRAWMDGLEVELDPLMPLIMINPEIIPVGDHHSRDVEGCLSIPGLHTEVNRPTRVSIVCQNLDGKRIALEAEGLLSRAAQHENDHLNGILFIDHLTPTELQEHQPLLRKLQAEATGF